MNKPKVAFICVHNSCRSQMAEAFGKILGLNVFESYSAGTEERDKINQDAVRIMKEIGVDMELTQRPKLLKVLPLAFDKEENKETKEQSAKGTRVQYLPSAEVVLGHIIPKYVSGIVYDGVIESFASEQAARRTAMSSANDNADEMLSNLELSYNRARQSAVTQEITEIVGGVEALK